LDFKVILVSFIKLLVLTLIPRTFEKLHYIVFTVGCRININDIHNLGHEADVSETGTCL